MTGSYVTGLSLSHHWNQTEYGGSLGGFINWAVPICGKDESK